MWCLRRQTCRTWTSSGGCCSASSSPCFLTSCDSKPPSPLPAMLANRVRVAHHKSCADFALRVPPRELPAPSALGASTMSARIAPGVSRALLKLYSNAVSASSNRHAVMVMVMRAGRSREPAHHELHGDIMLNGAM